MLSFTPGHRMTLCTCHVLTGNDGATIADTLDSAIQAKAFTKILVVMDVKSGDNTGRIVYEYAQEFPHIQIAPYKWEDPPDFAAVRNYAISITRTPYALWLDGDEKVVEAHEIRWMLETETGQAFSMLVISPKPDGGFHNMLQPRLFPVVPGVFFQCPVFERIDWSLAASGVRIQMTDTKPIFHPGYEDAVLLREKNRRNVRIMEKYLREHRTDDPQRAHIMAQYRKLKRA